MLKKYLDINYIKAWLKEYFEDKSNFYTTIGLVIFLVGWGSYKLYNYHSYNVQIKAQAQFSDALEVYNRALAMDLLGMNTNDASKKVEWDDAELAFRIGYEQNKNAGITPFFLAYQAQSLARQGDYQKALTILDDTEKYFSNDINWSYLFQITRALILFNFDQMSGLNTLKQLAYDEKNPLDLMALYYLGEYYYAQGDLDGAKKTFNDVIIKDTKNELDIVSPYIELAKKRLEQL